MNIPIIRKVLQKNDDTADANRARFDRAGVACVNLIGGAGCGKTALLEAVLPRLRGRLAVAVLEGDLATTRDAERIARLGVPTAQLLTDGGCHLTADHVAKALESVPLCADGLLVIENVGNPICPANFDLGEHARIAVLSVAEGDDKPSKYPLLFRKADLVVVSKADLLAHVTFNLDAAVTDVRRLNPEAQCRLVSARSGLGCDAVADWLMALVRRRAAARPAASARA